MKYILDFDWEKPVRKHWIKRYSWSKFRRGEAVRIWVNIEQNERLIALEGLVHDVEQKALAVLRAAHPRLNSKWNDGCAQQFAAQLRRELEANGHTEDSSTFVACDRAANKIMGFARDRHRRALPFRSREERVVTMRLACGLWYERPVEARIDENAFIWWGLGSLGFVSPFAASLDPLSKIDQVDYVEIARMARSWWLRPVWKDASASLPQSVVEGQDVGPPPVAD